MPPTIPFVPLCCPLLPLWLSKNQFYHKVLKGLHEGKKVKPDNNCTNEK
jgi:hypothetical protein